MQTHTIFRLALLASHLALVVGVHFGELFGGEVSHAPLRRNPTPAKRPFAAGPSFFVDARQGSDDAIGTQAAPWKSLRHALRRLRAGNTLYLREGIYRENVYVALKGTEKAPITIRAFPGEQAVIDGSLPEFFEAPATAWTPVVGGAPFEFRSTKSYPNLRDFVGSFGDSMIGTTWSPTGTCFGRHRPT